MADSKNNDVEMNGEDFSKDVTTSENENGTGINGTNGNVDGQSNVRDDDR